MEARSRRLSPDLGGQERLPEEGASKAESKPEGGVCVCVHLCMYVHVCHAWCPGDRVWQYRDIGRQRE